MLLPTFSAPPLFLVSVLSRRVFLLKSIPPRAVCRLAVFTSDCRLMTCDCAATRNFFEIPDELKHTLRPRRTSFALNLHHRLLRVRSIMSTAKASVLSRFDARLEMRELIYGGPASPFVPCPLVRVGVVEGLQQQLKS